MPWGSQPCSRTRASLGGLRWGLGFQAERGVQEGGLGRGAGAARPRVPPRYDPMRSPIKPSRSIRSRISVVGAVSRALCSSCRGSPRPMCLLSPQPVPQELLGAGSHHLPCGMHMGLGNKGSKTNRGLIPCPQGTEAVMPTQNPGMGWGGPTGNPQQVPAQLPPLHPQRFHPSPPIFHLAAGETEARGHPRRAPSPGDGSLPAAQRGPEPVGPAGCSGT